MQAQEPGTTNPPSFVHGLSLSLSIPASGARPLTRISHSPPPQGRAKRKRPANQQRRRPPLVQDRLNEMFLTDKSQINQMFS